jgi:hypothetical protein
VWSRWRPNRSAQDAPLTATASRFARVITAAAGYAAHLGSARDPAHERRCDGSRPTRAHGAQGEQQAQHAVKAANRESGGAVPKSVVNLTSCIASAGTNTGKLQACQAKYQP